MKVDNVFSHVIVLCSAVPYTGHNRDCSWSQLIRLVVVSEHSREPLVTMF